MTSASQHRGLHCLVVLGVLHLVVLFYQFVLGRFVLETFYYFAHLTIVVFLLIPVILSEMTRKLSTDSGRLAVAASAGALLAIPLLNHFLPTVADRVQPVTFGNVSVLDLARTALRNPDGCSAPPVATAGHCLCCTCELHAARSGLHVPESYAPGHIRQPPLRPGVGALRGDRTNAGCVRRVRDAKDDGDAVVVRASHRCYRSDCRSCSSPCTNRLRPIREAVTGPWASPSS